LLQPLYGLRTDRYMLTHYYATGEWELFDKKKDPQQMSSVYADRKSAATISGTCLCIRVRD